MKILLTPSWKFIVFTHLAKTQMLRAICSRVTFNQREVVWNSWIQTLSQKELFSTACPTNPSNFQTFRRLWTVILVLFYHPKKWTFRFEIFFCVIMTKTNDVSLPNIAGTTSLLFNFLYVAINIYQILSLFLKLFQEFWKISWIMSGILEELNCHLLLFVCL